MEAGAENTVIAPDSAADEEETLAETLSEAVESVVLGSAYPAAEEISEVMEEMLDPDFAALEEAGAFSETKDRTIYLA